MAHKSGRKKLTKKNLTLVTCPCCKDKVPQVELQKGRKFKGMTCCLCRTIGW